MGVATLVSVEEYLASTWRPDRELVDGVLLERNVGQKDHSNIQTALAVWFASRRQILRLKPFVELRIRVSASRFRIPDVTVVHLPEPDEQVLIHPPYICIEVISPDDTLRGMQERFDDYLNMGVSNVWAIDPETFRAWVITQQGHIETHDGILRTADARVEIPLASLADH